MIKWLSGSRPKDTTTVHEPTPLTNDPLAVISGINCPDGKYHIYAVSRVNPLYKEEENEEEEETTLDENSADQRSSPRKSVSSGYESRCNSSSESSSCTECENETDKTKSNRREKRVTKSLNKNEKKKKAATEYDKPGELKDNRDHVKSSIKYKNGSPPGSSNLSPIPEGKVDCSIPPPIWPRCEENCSHRGGKSLDNHVPGRTFFHDGTTNPVNFVFKYNERYPRCSYGTKKGPDSVSEYERNWKEFSNDNNLPDRNYISGQGVDDSGKGSTPESTLESRDEFTQEVIRDLANLIAYALSKKNSIPIDEIMKTLSESIQKSLQVLSQTENDDSLKKLCNSLSYFKNKALEETGEERNGINTRELAEQLQKLKDRTKYDSESEAKSSSSSGCKDVYISSTSSSAGKDGVYSSSSFGSVHERQKIFHREKPKKSSSDSDVSFIHHQRDCSSSSVESTFGYSDSTPTPPSGLLNPVFVHDDIYSVPKSVRNTIICDTLNRTNDSIKNTTADCGSSAFAKLISAKRKISIESRTEEIGPLKLEEEVEGKISISTAATSIKVDNTILKKVEHPYYVAMGRPDFTLDLPQAERLMKKIASSKRRRCWCRLMTSILGLVFFLLSVMMVSLVITKGRRMFGAI